MVKYQVPVLVTVMADSVMDAQRLTRDIFVSAEGVLKNQEPIKYKRWKKWGFASIRYTPR